MAPYSTFGSSDLADDVSAALTDRRAALMANHGSVAVSGTVAEALDHALLLEWLCGVYRDASALGTPRVLDAAQQQAVVEAALARSYGTLRRRPTRPGVLMPTSTGPTPDLTSAASSPSASTCSTFTCATSRASPRAPTVSSSSASRSRRPAPPAAPPWCWRSSALDVASIGATGRDPLARCCASLLRPTASTSPASSSATSRPRPACCRCGPTATGRPGTASAPTALHARRRGPRRGRRRRPAAPRRSGVPRRRGRRPAPAHARAHGTVTAVDLLAPGDPDMLAWVADAPPARRPLPAQRRAAPRADRSRRPHRGRRALLLERGVGHVAVTAGADGALVVSAADARRDGAGLRRRRRGHHRLRRRLQRRLPRRDPRRPLTGGRCRVGQRDRGAGRPGCGDRPRRLRPRVGGGLRAREGVRRTAR